MYKEEIEISTKRRAIIIDRKNKLEQGKAMTASEIVNTIVNAIVTLVAAGAGAWAAFALERSQKERDEKSHRVDVGQRALYTVFNIWNIQEQYRKEIIEPYRGRPDAWLNMSPTPTRPSGLLKFEAGELSFLLGTHTGAYSELLMEEQRFSSVMQLIEMRSRIVLNEVWPRMTAAGIQLNQPVEDGAMRRLLGVGITRQLEVLTESITSHIGENLDSLVKVDTKLREALEQRFPKQRFVRVEFRLPDAPA